MESIEFSPLDPPVGGLHALDILIEYLSDFPDSEVGRVVAAWQRHGRVHIHMQNFAELLELVPIGTARAFHQRRMFAAAMGAFLCSWAFGPKI